MDAMDVEKSEVLRSCKTLLRLVNCEAVIDTKDETLYDILFKSHAKKKMLLSWLIQQLYSADCCAMNSFEDLISTFISKDNLPNFLSGNMPILEQYKRWNLIMNVLHRRQRRKMLHLATDVREESDCGILFEKLENMWNEKLGSALNYVGLISAKETKLKAEELHLLLESVQANKMSPFPIPNEQYIAEDGILGLDSFFVHVETLQNSIEKLNYSIKEDFGSLVCSPTIRQQELAPRYQNLNSLRLNDTKNKLQTLMENVGMISKLIHGVENLQF